MALILGLASGLAWGTADFFGGLQSRRLPALAVAFWSQVAGGLGLALLLLARGEPPVAESVLWGCVAGLFGGGGLVLFYRALAQGVMGVVAPIAASGAAVPVLFSIVQGERPGLFALAGIAVALLGVVLVSLQTGEGARAPLSRGTLALALGSALGFGLFFVFLDLASGGGSSPLWAIGGARLGSLATLSALVLGARQPAPWPGRRIGAVAAVGVLDTTANGLYAYATAEGELGVVAVLGSLYPVATVLLGRLVLAERLSRLQGAGVSLALLGVALLSQ